MASRIVIRPREYHDSVRLMRASEAIRQEAGVREAMAMMATANNKKILDTSGLLTDEVKAANPDDLIIAVVAESEAEAENAISAAQDFLNQKVQSGQQTLIPRSIDAACATQPAINLACISVPGIYAYREVKRALELNLNVFLFSDNVSRADERKLKELAKEKNRLLMGPDCGTALINGIGLGFANAVRRGRVGLVAASGTGTQEISSLLDWLGCGVSQAIGTGGRDLQQDIGGLTMLQGLAMLAEDAETDVIVVTSKPPSPDIADTIVNFCAKLDKPVVINFVGQNSTGQNGNITFTSTLAQTALTAGRLIDPTCELPQLANATKDQFVQNAKAARGPSQRYLRGLYAGGTLCYEALFLLREQLGGIYSNLEHGAFELKDLFSSKEHTIIDLGDDAYTEGRAHPMIDPTLRNQRILQEAQDPEVAVLLLDLVIGYGAHENPAAQLAQTLVQAREIARADGRELPVIVTICGTKNDVQNYDQQAAQLRDADILVAGNNAEAVLLAGRYMETINV
ncbi:acyl-CoA synthetase FdrA [Acetobacter ghanensis]|uniref:Acyl-CoA synthetase FdrA n=1 Tax=Acetobacter ghanensis TaxID=431306 RepID=A0A0U5F9Q7_9PROT|nr:acyl-CoA synthetase FdrA [Acetobacter ghanensis]NHO38923.1 acyl-CoA synthetase FdrA [Acetobacter ghanensis]CEF57098.1 FdrA family protein [Acetobacter ghanensis]